MKEESPSLKDITPPEIGDLVRFKDGNTSGRLVAIEGDKAELMAGRLRLKTVVSKLVKVTDSYEIQRASFQSKSVHYKRRFVEPKIDIHGMRADEALKKINRYLDDALASGRNEVDIMHGKGKGILKKVVHDCLEERNEVKSYRMAPAARGGTGCTIVELQ